MDDWNIIGNSSMPDGDTCKTEEDEVTMPQCFDVDAVVIGEDNDDVLPLRRWRTLLFDGISLVNLDGLDVLIRC